MTKSQYTGLVFYMFLIASIISGKPVLFALMFLHFVIHMVELQGIVREKVES
jgi:hypothetical protein